MAVSLNSNHSFRWYLENVKLVLFNNVMCMYLYESQKNISGSMGNAKFNIKCMKIMHIFC